MRKQRKKALLLDGKRKKTPKEHWDARLKDYDLVVFREKHGSYYLSLTPQNPELDSRSRGEVWAEICMAVVEMRIRSKYISTKEPKIPVAPKPIDNREPLSEQKQRLRELENYEHALEWAKTERQEWELVQRIRAGDKWAAVELVMLREGGEYEGFSFEAFRDPSDFYAKDE
jgi:hypothetical protein